MPEERCDLSTRPRRRGELLLNRRGFLAAGTGGLVAAAGALTPNLAALAARRTSDSVHGPIVITDIETHDVKLDYLDWLHYELNHFYGPTRRTVYVVHTDKGFYGLGEGRSEPQEVLQQYIGTSPFDWVGDETSVPMAKAMYDLMGKAAGVPVYKLFGQRYRRWVPVGSWTVSTHPPEMADAVRNYAAMGYTWMKYHLSPFENVFDQLEAMEQVAPKGFKLQFDLTRFHHYGHNPDLVERVARSPIAGSFEDPLDTTDVDAYIDLRKRIRLPIIIHGSRFTHSFDVLRRAADGYIIGHHKLGMILQRAGLFAAAGVPFMIQWVGGHITRAMTTHMQAAFKTASLHFHCDAETWKSDVVKERLEPINGFLRVPERPGLGVTLDRGRTGAPQAQQPAGAAPLYPQDPLPQRHHHVQHHEPREVPLHGAARPMAPDAHELRLARLQPVLGRRRIRGVPGDVPAAAGRRHGAPKGMIHSGNPPRLPGGQTPGRGAPGLLPLAGPRPFAAAHPGELERLPAV